MVGDNITTDMLFASNSGIKSLMVLSGVSTMRDVEECQADEAKHKMIPTYYCESLGALFQEFNSELNYKF